MTHSNLHPVAVIHGERLQKELQTSETADALFTTLAMRERTRGHSNIRRLKAELQTQGFNVVEKELEAAFQALERDGAGVIIRSRKYGMPARFLWKYDMRRVAQAVIQGKDTPVQELPKDMQRAQDGPRTRRRPADALKVAQEVLTAVQSVPSMLKINGRTFIDIPEAEYLELKRMKEILTKLVK